MGITYERGRYKLKIISQGFTESKEKKTPCFFLEGEPVAKLDDDGKWYQTEVQYARTIRLWMTNKTIEQTAERLRALGWSTSRWLDLDPSNPNHKSFVGQEIEVECSIDRFDNGEYEKWDFPYEGGSKSENDPALAKKMDALFGKAAKVGAKTTNAPPNGNPAMPTQEELQEVAAGRDLPF